MCRHIKEIKAGHLYGLSGRTFTEKYLTYVDLIANYVVVILLLLSVHFMKGTFEKTFQHLHIKE